MITKKPVYLLSNFSTTSIYGSNILLKGSYRLEKQGSGYPKIPAGTLLYLEME